MTTSRVHQSNKTVAGTYTQVIGINIYREQTIIELGTSNRILRLDTTKVITQLID